MQIFGKQSYSQNARKVIQYTLVITLHNMPWESNRGSQEQDIRSPPNYDTNATSLYTLQICEFVNYIYM